ncbi:MAG: hypothetical protein O3B24_01570 [Verrucomicrobia bacterium]|nr:hypothetical protein [Verrucomicrobiota bacterium]
MVCPNTTYVRKVMRAARELTLLADEGEADMHDDGCAILVGVIRDCACKLRARAEHEMQSRKASGSWDASAVSE